MDKLITDEWHDDQLQPIYCNVTALVPTTLDQSSNHSLLTPAGDQLVAREGNAHFFTATRIRSGEQEKIEEQTNKHEQSLGLTKSRRRSMQHYMHVQTNASVG